MFSPFKVNGDFLKKIVSLYIANATLSAGTVVDIDPSDTTAITNSVGFTSMRAGGVVPATIANTAQTFQKALGLAIPDVTSTGPSFETRVLELAASYMQIPTGYAVAVFKPATGDIVATDQYVGNLAGDTGATGILDVTNVANFLKPLGVFQGRFRIAQAGDAVIGRYLGNTTVDGAEAILVEFA